MKNKVKKYIVNLLKKNRKQKGFTMIEMVIVVAIIAILIMLIAPNLLHQKERADDKSAQAFKMTLETQAQLYKDDQDDKEKDEDKKEISFENMEADKYLTKDQVKKAKREKFSINKTTGKVTGKGDETQQSSN